jgi:hypothetical protein
MQNNYTFLTDHSYSIRLNDDKLPLKQREIKIKKRRGISNRSSMKRIFSNFFFLKTNFYSRQNKIN